MVRQPTEHPLSQQERAERLGIDVRQFKRLVQGGEQDGAVSPVSRQRGVASHNRLADDERTRITGLLERKDEAPAKSWRLRSRWNRRGSRYLVRQFDGVRSAQGFGNRSGDVSDRCFRRGNGDSGLANSFRSTPVRMPGSRDAARNAR